MSDWDLDSASSEVLGDQIRQLRKAKGLTLAELATLIGKTPGFLSQIERGLARPGLGTLRDLGAALGTGVAWFFDVSGSGGEDDESRFVVRRSKRRRLRYVSHAEDAELPFEDSLISPHLNGSFVCLLCKLAPGGSYGKDIHKARGEFFLCVTSGLVDVELGSKRYALKPGDSIQFDGMTNHRISNPGDTTAEFFWVQHPVLFSF